MGRDSQIFACQLARSRSAEDAVLCPSDMMLCVISYWVLSGAKQTIGTTPHTGGALGNLNLIGSVWGRKLALSAPAPGYKELEVQVKEVCVCEAMKSPVGTLSNGTVLRQQDGGTKSRQVPIWEKSNLTLEEAAAYSGIGINKLREITNEDKCKFVLWVGNKRLIKRRLFDCFVEQAYSI